MKLYNKPTKNLFVFTLQPDADNEPNDKVLQFILKTSTRIWRQIWG